MSEIVTKKSPNYKPLAFVLKARCKKWDYTPREIYRCVCIDGTKAICTDTKRLHISEVFGLESGIYNVGRMTKHRIELIPNTEFKVNDFPDWKKVFPPEPPERIIHVFGNVNVKIAQILRMTESCYDVNYLLEAVDGPMKISWYGPYKPILLTSIITTSLDTNALIMPITLNDNKEERECMSV